MGWVSLWSTKRSDFHFLPVSHWSKYYIHCSWRSVVFEVVELSVALRRKINHVPNSQVHTWDDIVTISWKPQQQGHKMQLSSNTIPLLQLSSIRTYKYKLGHEMKAIYPTFDFGKIYWWLVPPWHHISWAGTSCRVWLPEQKQRLVSYVSMSSLKLVRRGSTVVNARGAQSTLHSCPRNLSQRCTSSAIPY